MKKIEARTFEAIQIKASSETINEPRQQSAAPLSMEPYYEPTLVLHKHPHHLHLQLPHY